MLRTHKLAEADRIVTLLTREHGRVRAVAKGVRRTTSTLRLPARALHPRRPDARRGPQPGHRDPGRDAQLVLRDARQRLRALHRRHRDAGDRRAARLGGEAAVGPAVPAARGRAARDGGRRPPARRRSSTPTCCARCRSPATRRRSTHCAHCAPARARTAGSTRRWAACCARPAGCPGSASPAAETVTLLGALLAGDWPVVEARRSASPHRGERAGRGVPPVAPRARAASPWPTSTGRGA